MFSRQPQILTLETGGDSRMDICLVCNTAVDRQRHIPTNLIPLLGFIESNHGWVAHSDCMFPLAITSN